MDETDNRIINDFRKLVIDNVLPRLTDLEEEVRLLRKVTWPVCQSLREVSQLDDLSNKREFLFHLTEEEAKSLLIAKAKLQGKYSSPSYSQGNSTLEEFSILTSTDSR